MSLLDLFNLAMIAAGIIVALVVLFVIVRLLFAYGFRKVDQGQALVRNGVGGTQVSFSGMAFFPAFHVLEIMDISVKRVEIDRGGATGLICRDNLRADIKVAFFVRVNNTTEDVKRVAQTIGCARASDIKALVELFDAKFSEALKTVGRRFDFVDLYNSREKFKEELLQIIGTDLNGYTLDDAAIDYLEQTKIELLDPENILDSEGIKKITDQTAQQKILTNQINCDREKTITQQNVEAREAVLELERQLAEAEQKQQREIAAIKAREEAETAKVQQEERLKSERARLITEEEVKVAEENLQRQVIVALRNKERTDAVEKERVEKDRLLEVNERERIVTLAEIEKEKAIETERKEIQEVIRDRVMVQKTVVAEQERIKDTEAFAEADRIRRVKITQAEAEADALLVQEIKAAEAAKKAAELKAQQEIIEAEAHKDAATLAAEGKKQLAEGVTAETAAPGLAEAHVLEAKAQAVREQGTAEADVLRAKAAAEAEGITAKAEAMKLFDGVGREHEEFKLKLNVERDLRLAEIHIRKDIAEQQAAVLGEALQSAKIEIIGGEHQFFDRIANAVGTGKTVDRLFDHSGILSSVHETFFNEDPDAFKTQLRRLVDQFGLASEDLKNLSIAGAIGQLLARSTDESQRTQLRHLSALGQKLGLLQQPAA